MSDLIDRILIGNLVDSNGNVHYEDILKLPTVEQKHKFGRWVKNCTLIQCSECGRSSWSLEFESIVKNFRFCPNCGARMVTTKNECIT